MELPKSVHLEIPFIANDGDGNQCVQVCLGSMLLRHTGKAYSLPELDVLTHRKHNNWTWTQQLVAAGLEKQLDIRFYTRTPMQPFLRGEAFLREQYGDATAERFLEKSDVPAMIVATQRILKENVVENRVLSISEIREALALGHTVCLAVDLDTLRGAPSSIYTGHFIILTGYGPTHWTYHESGPRFAEANKIISESQLFAAWNHKDTDNDVIIVRGGVV